MRRRVGLVEGERLFSVQVELVYLCLLGNQTVWSFRCGGPGINRSVVLGTRSVTHVDANSFRIQVMTHFTETDFSSKPVSILSKLKTQ